RPPRPFASFRGRSFKRRRRRGNPMSDTKFSEFVKSKKLDLRRLLNASHQLETLRPDDRSIRLAKRQAKAKAEADGNTAKETRKTRSGHPVTGRALEAALQGGKLAGP